jgi:hypothetical protein
MLVDLPSFVHSFVQALPTFVACFGGRSRLLRICLNVGRYVLHTIRSVSIHGFQVRLSFKQLPRGHISPFQYV